jgi:hypothetical protein
MLHSAQYKHWRFWREGKYICIYYASLSIHIRCLGIEKPTTNAQQPAGDAETKPNAS